MKAHSASSQSAVSQTLLPLIISLVGIVPVKAIEVGHDMNGLREMRADVSNRPDMVLSTGNELTFFRVKDATGQEDGVLVVEAVKDGGTSVLEFLSEQVSNDLTEEEIRDALADPGSGRSGWARAQFEGWAAEKRRLLSSTNPSTVGTESTASKLVGRAISKAANVDLACSNSWFNSWSWGGGAVGSTYFIRNDVTPKNYTGFKTYCFNPASNGQCWDAPRYQYSAVWNNLRAWVGKTCAKTIDSPDHHVCWTSNSGGAVQCTNFWPTLSFQTLSSGKWTTAKNSQGKAAYWTVAPGAAQAYFWRYSGSARSWRIHVQEAKLNDQFDFLMNR